MTKKELVRAELKDVLLKRCIPSYQRYMIYKCCDTIDKMIGLKQFIENNTGVWLIIRKSRNGRLASIELSPVRNERVDICIAI